MRFTTGLQVGLFGVLLIGCGGETPRMRPDSGQPMADGSTADRNTPPADMVGGDVGRDGGMMPDVPVMDVPAVDQPGVDGGPLGDGPSVDGLPADGGPPADGALTAAQCFSSLPAGGLGP